MPEMMVSSFILATFVTLGTQLTNSTTDGMKRTNLRSKIDSAMALRMEEIRHCAFFYLLDSSLLVEEDDIATQKVADIFGEEVILSHEVMEAVNGKDSAEILRLPNLKTFSYLRRHYTQQSAKLPDQVFERQAWEMIRPEV